MVKSNGNSKSNRNGNGRMQQKPQRQPRRNGNTNPVLRGNRGLPIATLGRNSRTTRQACHVFSGSDFLTKVSIKANPAAAQDRILLSQDISPASFLGTRLTQLSSLWERYRFVKFNIRYVPAVPTTLACQLVGYFDTDPTDDPTIISNPDSLIRQAVAHSGAHQWNFIAPNTISIPQRSDDEMYYTGSTDQNVRFNLQGKFFLIQVTNPLSFSGEAVPNDLQAGSLYIDWTCKFQIDQIEPESSGSVLDPQVVDPQRWINTVYTSDKPDQAATRLITVSGLLKNAIYAVTTFSYLNTFSASAPTILGSCEVRPVKPITSTDEATVLANIAEGNGSLRLSLVNSSSPPTEFAMRIGIDQNSRYGALLVVRTDSAGQARLYATNSETIDALLETLNDGGLLFSQLLI